MGRWKAQVLVVVVMAAFAAGSRAAQNEAREFAKNHALVIGIDEYHSPWPTLGSAVKDAKDIADYLERQGFVTLTLYGSKATKAAIIHAFEDELPARVGPRDRVFVFFAGHGATRDLGGTKQGYLVPADGTAEYASMIPMSSLQYYSATLNNAQHQLFILDACFGGLAAKRGVVLNPSVPDYIHEISARKVRQLLTAGGEGQYVSDSGTGGNGYFTGYLLRALREGAANSNGDSFITFSELVGYIQAAASTRGQTPLPGIFDGHENGDFWFADPTHPARVVGGQPVPAAAANVDVYEVLIRAKQAFKDSQLPLARSLFQQAADLRNAEAMGIFGVMLFDGVGGPKDELAAIRLLEEAGERGDINAMKNLEKIYERQGNTAKAAAWKKRREDAEKLLAGLVLIDPENKARPGPILPAERLMIRPLPPSNFRVQ